MAETQPGAAPPEPIADRHVPDGRPSDGRSSQPLLRDRSAGSEFSLALNDDQLQVQKWVHGFAEEVVRPAAAEWDEREETPWPIIEEAARIGLYGLDFMANAFADGTGQTIP